MCLENVLQSSGCVRICKDMPECVKIFHNMQDMSGYVKFCQHMLEIIRICQDDMTMVKSLVKIWSLGGAAKWWQPHSVRLITFFTISFI